MSLRQVLRPKRPRWLQATLAACALMVLAAGVSAWRAPWSPKHGLGLALGILAGLVFVFEMLYPARRSRARPLRGAQDWLQAHIYLGVVALLAVVLHAGWRWPAGAMGWALLLLSVWVSLSGLLGVWLQKWIPAALAEGLRVEALYERVPELVAALTAEGDEMMRDASDTLESFYLRDVRPMLCALRPSWAFLLDVRAGRERALEPFRRIGPFVEPEERAKLDDLMNVLTEKLELDAHHSLQGVLRRWLALHVPAAGLLLGLLLAHVGAWAWY